MSKQIQAPKGVPEYLGSEGNEFLSVRSALSQSAVLSGYEYIELPVYEDTALFVRGVGESTDVVSKEMFTFTDRGERSITLRPEGTAGVMRAAIEHGLERGQLPVKLWYAGPFFRAERPQAGRYRQLQQVGIEAIGSEDPMLDAEVIAIADEAFKRVGLRQYTLHLNSLGCAACRPAYREELVAFLSTLDLDEATVQRASLNPLRVLDDKRESVQRQLVQAPLQVNRLCGECVEHYAAVRHYLQLQGVSWTEAPRMVRGLDYYTRTTFEFEHSALGAQSGIGGGGRYDGLMSALGGSDLSGIGFGLGVDRTLLAARAEGLRVATNARVDAYLIALGAPAANFVVKLSAQLRATGIPVDMSFGGRGLKGAMKAADRSGARAVVVVGDEDLADGVAAVKDMQTGEQSRVPIVGLVEHLRTFNKEMSGA